MPHRPGRSARAQRGVWLLEQSVQVPEVAAAVGAQRWFQFGGMPPAGDDVRIGVLRLAARPEQVVDQPGDALAVRLTFPIMPDPLPQFLGGLVEEPGPADALRGVREEVAAVLAGGVQLGDGLVEVDADPADQPGSADQFGQRIPQRSLAGAGPLRAAARTIWAA